MAVFFFFFCLQAGTTVVAESLRAASPAVAARLDLQRRLCLRGDRLADKDGAANVLPAHRLLTGAEQEQGERRAGRRSVFNHPENSEQEKRSLFNQTVFSPLSFQKDGKMARCKSPFHCRSAADSL